MTIEIRVPQLPESVSDASIAAWAIKEGDSINIEDNILELETDKVVLEVPAPASGVLIEIKAQQGDIVLAGDIIGIIDETATVAPSQTKVSDANTNDSSVPVSASPSVRKTMAENNVDATQVQGSGKHGLISKNDVDTHLQNQSAHATTTEPEPSTIKGQDTSLDTDERSERRVPMTRLRTRIAERLLEAQQTAAILTTFNEVDLSEVSRLRRKYQERFKRSHDVKLGFMSFFLP